MAFRPPEVIENSTYFETSDIFSLGIVFYNLLSGGENPFGKLSDIFKLMGNIKDGKADFSKINSKNFYLGEKWLELLNILLMMTKVNALQRPNSKELLESTFF